MIGVLPGTGIGPQVIESALKVLRAVEEVAEVQFQIRQGGPIGEDAEAIEGKGLTNSVVRFCSEIFQQGGAVLSGPGGGRYVYELRREFDLFCKFVPVVPSPKLASAGRLSPCFVEGVDMLIVRDNAGGVYQGEWREHASEAGRVAHHSFSYSEQQIQRITDVAARAAAGRRGIMHVIVKAGGVPGMTELWREVALASGRKYSIDVAMMNVDLAVYELIQNPKRFDVVVAPNLFGDIIADVSGVLVSSRGVTFSGNYDANGNGVYQTNHGCAHDLAGLDVANPAGQIYSLAMLLRESFGLYEIASLMEQALDRTWEKGWRTADIVEEGCQRVGTKAMTDRIVEEVYQLAEAKQVA